MVEEERVGGAGSEKMALAGPTDYGAVSSGGGRNWASDRRVWGCGYGSS